MSSILPELDWKTLQKPTEHFIQSLDSYLIDIWLSFNKISCGFEQPRSRFFKVVPIISVIMIQLYSDKLLLRSGNNTASQQWRPIERKHEQSDDQTVNRFIHLISTTYSEVEHICRWEHPKMCSSLVPIPKNVCGNCKHITGIQSPFNLAWCCVLTRPADTDHVEWTVAYTKSCVCVHLIDLSPIFTPLLALFLASTNPWGKYQALLLLNAPLCSVV